MTVAIILAALIPLSFALAPIVGRHIRRHQAGS